MTNSDNLVIAKCNEQLLKILTDLLQSVTRFNLRQVLHSSMDLLQNATSITKCNDY